MRKRIGIFIGDAQNEYQKTIIKAVYKQANNLGYDVLVFGMYGSFGDNVLYAEGERNMLSFPDILKLDGIIACEDTFDIDFIEEQLEDLLRTKAQCPVVYLRREKEDFYNVIISGKKTMAVMTRHFVEDHGFHDICFMQGPMIYKDARDRYHGFLEVMEEHGIPVTEHMVFEGDYWREKGAEAVEWFMEGRTTYPQAIICSNDYMAIAVCDELKKRGIRIPEDVCVSGYDNTFEARRYLPSITSANVDFAKLAEMAVQVIDNVVHGRPQKQTEEYEPEIVIHKSCGCGKQVYIDDISEVMNKIDKQDNNIKKIVFMTSEYQDAYEEDEYLRIASHYFHDTNATKGYLCLCMDEQSDDTDQKRVRYSSKMMLKRIFSQKGKPVVCDEIFDRTDILPAQYMDTEKPAGYLLLGIHHKNRAFGYFVLTFEDDQWVDGYIQPYIMCIANVLEDAEMHKQINDLREIQKLYQMDALTGIYNRRGFERQLSFLYDEMKETGIYLTLVSIDMDYLKYINDNFGHGEGDFALCLLADVLKNMLGEREVCARVGGDEFCVLLVSENPSHHVDFGERFQAALEKAVLESKKNYPVVASYGICCINEHPELSLIMCLQWADAAMYELKKKHRAERGSLPTT